MTASTQDNIPKGGGHNSEYDAVQAQSEILNRCLEAIQSGRATPEECLQHYPQYAELEMLLQTALAMQELPRPSMPMVEKAQLRDKMLANFRAQKRPHPGRLARFSLRRLAVACMVLIAVFFSGAGMVGASDAALPGDMLYSVKRTVEQVQLSLMGSESRPIILDRIAQERLTELSLLSLRSKPIADSVIADASASVAVALQAQSNVRARKMLYDRTVVVLDQAEANGVLTHERSEKALSQLAGMVNTPVPLEVTNPPVAASTPVPTVMPTLTPVPTDTPSPSETEPPLLATDDPLVAATPDDNTTKEVPGIGSSIRANPTRKPTMRATPKNQKTPGNPNAGKGNDSGKGK